jgi:hypothetical protein
MVSFVNPCSSTTYEAISTVTYTDSFVYYLGGSKTLTYPFLNDSFNKLKGSSSTSSICGLTTVSLQDNGSTPAYVTVSTSTGSPVLTFSSSSSLVVGTHTLNIQYKLASFTTVTTSFTMTVYIC